MFLICVSQCFSICVTIRTVFFTGCDIFKGRINGSKCCLPFYIVSYQWMLISKYENRGWSCWVLFITFYNILLTPESFFLYPGLGLKVQFQQESFYFFIKCLLMGFSSELLSLISILVKNNFVIWLRYTVPYIQ